MITSEIPISVCFVSGQIDRDNDMDGKLMQSLKSSSMDSKDLALSVLTRWVVQFVTEFSQQFTSLCLFHWWKRYLYFHHWTGYDLIYNLNCLKICISLTEENSSVHIMFDRFFRMPQSIRRGPGCGPVQLILCAS